MTSPAVRRHGAALVGLCAGLAAPVADVRAEVPTIVAARTDAAIRVDGVLDEPAWRTAPPFDAFVQNYPVAGSKPSEATEVRVLYDARYLYVGVLARDSQSALIDHRLGRRDSSFTTDSIQLIIDSSLDHRTAFSFLLTAGGVHGDGLFYDDRNFTADWDAVWDGEVGSTPEGWVAEFAIPLAVLRFPRVPIQTWGFSVRRQIARRNEQIESVDNPPTSNAVVSRLGHLTGMAGLEHHIAVELLPYVAARGVVRPQYADPSRPRPRLLEPSLDVGIDLHAALTSQLALDATLNPDFGQVEADQIILNLTTYEVALPEKRPFFTKGLELFKPLGSDAQQVPQQLFYSRRIGLNTPILGAAKLTGDVAHGVTVGVVDALVASPWQIQDEAHPDHQWRLHLERPLHLGPDSALPDTPAPATNFVAAVARASVGPSSRIGASVVGALPLVGACEAEPATATAPSAACLARGGVATALDFDVRTASSEYGAIGQFAGSRLIAGPPARVLPDGSVLRPGTTGYGGYMRAGRFGGEGFRWEVGDDLSSPTLDLNATGFQRTQNEHAPSLTLRYERQSELGPLRGLSARLLGQGHWTTDGRAINRGTALDAALSITLPSFDQIGVEWNLDAGGYDVRELDGTGVPLQRDTVDSFTVFWTTNANRRLSATGAASLTRFGRGPVPAAWGGNVDVALSLRPHPALETGLEVVVDHTAYPPRFVDHTADGGFLLGALASSYLSVTLRQQWLIQPRLTLQAYAQLFVSHAAYGPYFTAASDADRAPVRFADLQPTASSPRRLYQADFNPSLVLVWEYRLGSTLSLVATHAQTGLPLPDGEPLPATLYPHQLFAGPATDALLVKWTYFYGL